MTRVHVTRRPAPVQPIATGNTCQCGHPRHLALDCGAPNRLGDQGRCWCAAASLAVLRVRRSVA